MDTKTQHGYLVLADISGFTSYLAAVELDHAHEILTDLLETIVAHFKSLLNICKLEGDAVFAYAPEAKVARGETLLELIETTYVAFRNRRDVAHRHTSCECKACRAIPSLDLKFFVHHGDYIVQEVSNIRELVGSDVNLVHRLMKNHLSGATGWKAYALFTDEGLAHMGVRPEGLHEQTETYEHLGDVQTLSLDLHSRYQALVEARRVIVAPEEADFVLNFDFPAPPPVVWEWLTDAKRKTQAMGGYAVFSVVSRPGGRSGPGAANHCAHGKGLKASLVETVLDWRPFEYFTTEDIEGNNITRTTIQFEPISQGKGTRTRTCMQMLTMPLPRWLKRPLVKYMMSHAIAAWYGAVAQLLAKDAGAAVEPAAAPAASAG